MRRKYANMFAHHDNDFSFKKNLKISILENLKNLQFLSVHNTQ